MRRHLYKHLNLSGHSGFLNYKSVTVVDKTDLKSPTKRQDYWINTLKAKASLGLNAEMVFRHNLLYFTLLVLFMVGCI